MLFDDYTQRIPDNCPSCKAPWKYPHSAMSKGHPMIAVKLSDCVDITCSNPKCRSNFVMFEKTMNKASMSGITCSLDEL